MNLSEEEMGTLEKSGLTLRIGTLMALIGSVVAGAVLGVGCGMPPYDESVTEKLLRGADKPKFHETTVGDRTIFYAATGTSNQPLVVFIHGTPGSWRGFGQYLADDSLRNRAQLIAVDRPGFGRSGHTHLVTSLREQADLLAQLLQRDFSGRRAILVGHSLGASIAARLAIDHPDLVEGLVLVAPSHRSGIGKTTLVQSFGRQPVGSLGFTTDLLLANQEVMPLYGERLQMRLLWKQIQVPVIVIQGDKDQPFIACQCRALAENVLGSQARIIRVPRAGRFCLEAARHHCRCHCVPAR